MFWNGRHRIEYRAVLLIEEKIIKIIRSGVAAKALFCGSSFLINIYIKILYLVQIQI